MVGHGGSSAGPYLADPTSPIPSHCASIVTTSTLRVNITESVLHAVFMRSCCGLVKAHNLAFVKLRFSWIVIRAKFLSSSCQTPYFHYSNTLMYHRIWATNTSALSCYLMAGKSGNPPRTTHSFLPSLVMSGLYQNLFCSCHSFATPNPFVLTNQICSKENPFQLNNIR